MAKSKEEAQNPLILRSHRLMEAFAKSDDERDFYLDRIEGFIVYVDLDKPQEDITALEEAIGKTPDRYVMIPKLTFFETKKIMEGFVNEKVYDIDTKEKLLDIIQSKEARENFLEFIYDHHSEQEKWQQFYQERSRIRIIEWLRNNHFHFVFEEDLEMPKAVIEKLKSQLFETKVGKDIQTARKALVTKAKTYYSNEALNPRPKRGRPPKQAIKLEIESQITTDIYNTVVPAVRPFLFTPDFSSGSALTFSSKFDSEDQWLAHRRSTHLHSEADLNLESINQKLALLRGISSKWVEPTPAKPSKALINGDDDEDEDEDEEDEFLNGNKKSPKPAKRSIMKPKAAPKKEKLPPKKPAKIKLLPKKDSSPSIRPKQQLKSKAAPSKPVPSKPTPNKLTQSKAAQSKPTPSKVAPKPKGKK